MSPPLAGYGAGPYGDAGYGSGSDATLALVDGFASSENVIQVRFNFPVYLSNLGDKYDAADPSHFAVTAVAGTTGLDGAAARTVTVVSVAYTSPPPTGYQYGAVLDLTLDRPMTPFPAQYTVSASNLISTDLVSPLGMPNSVTVYGLYHQIQQPTLTAPVPSRDIANPQSLAGANALPNPNLVTLGVFNVGDDGDYAYDSGEVAYKKRVYRRMTTKKGAFLHLPPTYGVGLPYEVKKLGSPVRRQEIAADIEQQIAQEPETQQCKVSVTMPQPGLTLVTLLAKMKGQATAQKLSATFRGS